MPKKDICSLTLKDIKQTKEYKSLPSGLNKSRLPKSELCNVLSKPLKKTKLATPKKSILKKEITKKRPLKKETPKKAVPKKEKSKTALKKETPKKSAASKRILKKETPKKSAVKKEPKREHPTESTGGKIRKYMDYLDSRWWKAEPGDTVYLYGMAMDGGFMKDTMQEGRVGKDGQVIWNTEFEKWKSQMPDDNRPRSSFMTVKKVNTKEEAEQYTLGDYAWDYQNEGRL
jgi:hypothetical protein